MVFLISGTVKATITAEVVKLFFLKTQEMVDNLLKIEYFHLKTLLGIHYLCTNIAAKFLNIRFKKKKVLQKSPLFQVVKLVVPLNIRYIICNITNEKKRNVSVRNWGPL